MKALLFVFSFTALGLGWLAGDGDSRRGLIREYRQWERDRVAAQRAEKETARVVEALEGGDADALYLVAAYHLGYNVPRHLVPVFAEGFGAPDSLRGMEVLHEAAEGGSLGALYRLYKLDPPSETELFAAIGQGNRAAVMEVQRRAVGDGCEWDLELLDRLVVALEEWPEAADSTFRKYWIPDIASLRGWHTENCGG